MIEYVLVVPFENINKLGIFMRSRDIYGCSDMILGPIGLLVRLSSTNVSMTQPSRSNRSLKLIMRGLGKGSLIRMFKLELTQYTHSFFSTHD